jgi:hypothetical protein
VDEPSSVSSCRGSAKAGGQLYGEPHTWSLPAARSRKSGFAPVLRNKAGRVHTGEQINFPHLAKNERDMGHPQLWLGESFNLTCRQASRLIEMTKLLRCGN